jgi:hypothetical protein
MWEAVELALPIKALQLPRLQAATQLLDLSLLTVAVVQVFGIKLIPVELVGQAAEQDAVMLTAVVSAVREVLAFKHRAFQAEVV